MFRVLDHSIFHITVESVKSRYSLSSDQSMKLSSHQANGLRKEGNGDEYNHSIFSCTHELSEFLNGNLHWCFSSPKTTKERNSLRDRFQRTPERTGQAATCKPGSNTWEDTGPADSSTPGRNYIPLRKKNGKTPNFHFPTPSGDDNKLNDFGKSLLTSSLAEISEY